MIYLDSHEPIDLELLLSQVLPVEREHLNPEKADLWWLGYDGKRLQLENKQAGEILGSLDSTEEQLGRELQAADYTGLTIRGVITPSDDGQCQVWGQGNNPNVMFRGRVFNTSYKGYRAWLSRLQELGIVVVEVPNVEALAITVIAMYEGSQKPDSQHKTFARLIPEHYWLTEEDLRKKDFALSLMGIRNAGWGEELALAAADRFDSLATFLNTLEAGADKEVASLPLRSGKRHIGPAAVERLKRAVGI